MSVNKAILIGNLGRDPETRYTKDGNPVTSFSIATSERRDGEEKTEWHNIVCFRKQAEIASEFLRKGSKVYIEGKIQTRQWEKEGQKHYSTEIVAFQIQFLDSKGEQERAQGHNYERQEQATHRSSNPTDDLIPF